MSPGLSLAMFSVAVLLYGSASVVYYLEIARPRADDSVRSRAAALLLAIGAAAHFGFVVNASLVARVCPVHSIHFALSVASLLATGTYLVARRRFRVHALGLVVAPVGLLLTLGTFFLGAGPRSSKLPASFIGLHVLSNLIGDALFLLACGAAVMYLVQEKRLKKKKTLLLVKKKGGLPALDSLDKALHRFLLAGFPLMTLGVWTGTVFAHQLEHGSLDEVLRAVFGWATWLLIAAVLLLRVVAGWRGRRAAYGTIAGFSCAVVVLLIYLFRPELKAAVSLGG
jgi:ABC-type uncharacterized transport system permease subunit